MRALLLLLLIGLAGCTPADKAVGFLDVAIANNEDPYLAYVYPGEALKCPLPECTITYRSLDRDFNLHFLGELGVGGKLKDDIQVADQVLEAVAKSWEDKGIYNVMNKPEKDGIALDTYCIVGFITNNSAMAEKVIAHSTDYHWLNEFHYQGDDYFRRLADESWCVRHIYKTRVEPEMLPKYVSTLIDETDKVKSSRATLAARVTGVIHTVYVLGDIVNQEESVPMAYREKLKEYQDFAFSSLKEPQLKNDTLTIANVLDALLHSGYPKEELDRYVGILERRQTSEGFWYPNVADEEKMAHVFTTFRVVLALERYEQS